MFKQAQKLITGIPYGQIAKGVREGAVWTVTKPWPQGITAATVGVITAHNVVVDGMDRGRENAKEEMGKGYVDLFKRSQSSPRECNLLEKVKIHARNVMFDNPVYPMFTKVKNHTMGFISEAASNIMNIAAVVGVALPIVSKLEKPSFNMGARQVKQYLLNNKLTEFIRDNKVINKYIPTIATTYLLLKAAKVAAVDVMGFGKKSS